MQGAISALLFIFTMLLSFMHGVSGTYKVDVRLGGVAIIGSPFYLKSFDKSQVRVFGLSDGVVNKTTTFTGLVYYGVVSRAIK